MPGKWGGARRARPPLDPPMTMHVSKFFLLFLNIIQASCAYISTLSCERFMKGTTRHMQTLDTILDTTSTPYPATRNTALRTRNILDLSHE